MMNRILFLWIPTVTAFLLITGIQSLKAGTIQDDQVISRKLNRDFQVNQHTTLSISNESGSVTCKNWDQQKVSIQITISVFQTPSRKAGEILDQVSVHFLETSDHLKVTTQIPSDVKVKGKLSIDYIIWMPYNLKINIMNKLGDVMIDEHRGEGQIEVDYGNLLVGALKHGNNLISVRFGTAKIESLKGAVVQASFAKLDIGYAGSLKLRSEHSDFNINKVIFLDGINEGGQMFVSSASVFMLKTTNAAIIVDSLYKRLDLTNEMGHVEIHYVDPGFQSISLFDEFGSHTIPLGHLRGFHINATSNHGLITLPDMKRNLSEESIGVESIRYFGVLGSDSTGKVKIFSEQGNVDLR